MTISSSHLRTQLRVLLGTARHRDFWAAKKKLGELRAASKVATAFAKDNEHRPMVIRDLVKKGNHKDLMPVAGRMTKETEQVWDFVNRLNTDADRVLGRLNHIRSYHKCVIRLENAIAEAEAREEAAVESTDPASV